MRRLVRIGTLAMAMALGLSAAAAGDNSNKAKDADVVFRKLDANMDGLLSKAEFLKIAENFRDRAKARRQLGLTYDRLDPTQHGLTREQFRTFVESRARQRENAKHAGK